MPPGPKFWRGLKSVARAGVVLSVTGALGCFLFLEGWMRSYFGFFGLILAFNFGLILYFTQHNDPTRRGDGR